MDWGEVVAVVESGRSPGAGRASWRADTARSMASSEPGFECREGGERERLAQTWPKGSNAERGVNEDI